MITFGFSSSKLGHHPVLPLTRNLRTNGRPFWFPGSPGRVYFERTPLFFLKGQPQGKPAFWVPPKKAALPRSEVCLIRNGAFSGHIPEAMLAGLQAGGSKFSSPSATRIVSFGKDSGLKERNPGKWAPSENSVVPWFLNFEP